MNTFIEKLKQRNYPLFVFGALCLIASLIALLLIFTTKTEVLGINAWIKPFKFFLSSTIFVWSMAWYMYYLAQLEKVKTYSYVVILVLAFEIIYIAIQAAKGQLSHFNISSPLYSTMFSLMGLAITIMTLWTGYIAYLFFRTDFPNLPQTYLWGIRLGLVFFVIFALEGGLMGSRLAHTVGAPDGGDGLPLINWSKNHGDLRIAHFFGMHALQILPLLGYFVITSTRRMKLIALLYFLIVSLSFVQALLGLPLI